MAKVWRKAEFFRSQVTFWLSHLNSWAYLPFTFSFWSGASDICLVGHLQGLLWSCLHRAEELVSCHVLNKLLPAQSALFHEAMEVRFLAECRSLCECYILALLWLLRQLSGPLDPGTKTQKPHWVLFLPLRRIMEHLEGGKILLETVRHCAFLLMYLRTSFSTIKSIVKTFLLPLPKHIKCDVNFMKGGKKSLLPFHLPGRTTVPGLIMLYLWSPNEPPLVWVNSQ